MDREPNVPGATPDELRQLAALGGLAAVFGAQEMSTWPTALMAWAFEAPRPPEELIELFRSSLQAGDDPFAEAYNASISPENRRRLGTVFTPEVVVEHMIDLVEEQLTAPPAVIVDPGAGVGAFTLAAARRWPDADVVAVDINVVTLGLLGARVAFERSKDETLAKRAGAVHLRLEDYLDAVPKLFASDAPGPVVALGNPPYTRTQSLSIPYKRYAASLGHGMVTSGHANLAMLFTAATFAALRPADVSCMVVPGSIVFTRAARDLRRELFESRRPIRVHRWPATERAFVGRNVQAAIVVIGPDGLEDETGIQLARADIHDGDIRLIERWSLDRTEPEPTNWYWPSDSKRSADDSVPLEQLAHVRRGLATGANSFFFVTDAMRDRLPDDVFLPAVPSLRNFDESVLTSRDHATWGGPEQRRWLLALRPDEEPTERVKDYLDMNREVVEPRHLCQQREVWWAITDLPRPQILFSPLAKTTFKVVRNDAGAIPSNNLLGITVKGADPAALSDWLRSEAGQAELLRVSRRYHGGSHKVEPGDLRRVAVPAKVAQRLRDARTTSEAGGAQGTEPAS